MSELAPEPTIPALIGFLDERVKALEGDLPALVSAEVEKLAGPVAGAAVKDALEPYVAQIRELTDKLAGAADREAAGIDSFAHAKIGAVVNAVERAIGIKIPMPTRPGEHVVGDVTVPGAETADQLSK